MLCVPLSAKSGIGLEELYEAIDLQSQLVDTLHADDKALGEGVVLESRLLPGEKGTQGPHTHSHAHNSIIQIAPS